MVADVHKDPRYLPTFGSTQSEIVVPIMDEHGQVVGMIDVESEKLNAFTKKIAIFSNTRHFSYRALSPRRTNAAEDRACARVVVCRWLALHWTNIDRETTVPDLHFLHRDDHGPI